MQVAVNPAAEAEPAAPAQGWDWMAVVDLVLDHWIAVILILAALVALCWIAPRAARSVAAWHRERHESYLRSEQYSFDRLRRAARGGDAKTSYFALLDWLQRLGPIATVDTLKADARDPVLGRELASLETRLFAGQPASADWSPRRFIRHVSAARRNLRRLRLTERQIRHCRNNSTRSALPVCPRKEAESRPDERSNDDGSRSSTKSTER